MADRIKRLAKPTALIAAIGFAYLLVHELTGFSLFCPFRRFLGIYCPGCGVSRMCFHIAHGELQDAFASNCAVFCLLPIGLSLAAFHAYRYLRYGDGSLYKAEKIGLWVAIVLLIVFAVVRNLFGILVPS